MPTIFVSLDQQEASDPTKSNKRQNVDEGVTQNRQRSVIVHSSAIQKQDDKPWNAAILQHSSNAASETSMPKRMAK